MPKFKVVEIYPQATATRVMIVEAETEAEAHDDPHSQNILYSGLKIEEGGEAYTESVSKLSSKEFQKTKKEIVKLL